MEKNIILPSKPTIVSEEGDSGVYSIENLYPGYGHTLGNSVRRILLSSIPGVAITQLRIKNVPQEFSTIEGVMEDVIHIILNLKKVRFSLSDSLDSTTIKLKKKGKGKVTVDDFELPTGVLVGKQRSIYS